MQYTQNLTLDVFQSSTFAFVQAKQGDSASRYVCITMTAGGAKITPPTTATATFRGLKPDGTSISSAATINDDGTVTVELTQQTLAAPGKVMADVLIEEDGEALSSESFCIEVQPAPMQESAEEA